MASTIIGRTTCPECGFPSAHVKKSDKCLYRYCPECGSQHMAKSKRQADDLMAKTRLVSEPPTVATGSASAGIPSGSDVAVAPPVPVATTPAAVAVAPPAPPAAPAKRRGLFG